jgi:hypothetical protein
MKLLKKIIFASTFFFFLLVSSNAVLIEFTWYKKSFFEQKVYSVYNFSWEHEIKWADYWSFKFWDGYAHDKNSIYLGGDIIQGRIFLDKTFNNFYNEIIYMKNDNVYYKNKYNDLIEITKKWDNLKVLYETNYYIWLRSNDNFFNIKKENYWFYNQSYKIDIENWCNISTLEYKDWQYFDGKNICWYAYPVPKKFINIVDNTIIKNLDKDYTLKVNKIHNLVYQKRESLREKINQSDPKQLLDKYLFVWMEHILEYIDCEIRKKDKDKIGCMDINRRNHIYPR